MEFFKTGAKLRHFLPKSTLVSVYYSIFHSHLSYGCQVWGQCNNCYTQRIFLLQKRAVRILTFSNWQSHSSVLFYELKILKFFDYVSFQNLTFTYKLLNNKLPSTFHNTFDFKRFDNDHNLRGKKIGSLVQHNFRTYTYGKYSIHFQAISNWNCLHSKLNFDDATQLSLGQFQNHAKLSLFLTYID